MPARRQRLLGVDVGGTFTDFLYWDGQQLQVRKRRSTPDDPARAVLEGIAAVGWAPDEVVHGSTVATNALLTRSGAPTGLITTKGFRDTLVIGRQNRPDLYALHPTRPEPLVTDARRLEVAERIAASGDVLQALDPAEVEAALDRLQRCGAETIAVCLLFAFVNPAHEQRIAAAARARDLHVSASHEVLPEYREYERMSTTVANAYLAPVMSRYLRALEDGLTTPGSPVRLRIMQSNGGSLEAEQAGAHAVRTVLSGPAGGVAGAFAEAQRAGFSHVITFDMGGTSTDVSLCPGRILERTDLSIGGMPIQTQAVAVHSVGAGGGSIAWLDSGGALRVGPQSAGAEPGPAAFGNGSLPTVTDAHVVLGRLGSDHFLGGELPLLVDRAERAIASRADGFGGDNRITACAVIDVVNATMARALRVISVEQGYDPRDFTLVAFGGAGPLHACDLADALGIGTVMIPATPGVLSAAGMLQADITKDAEQGLIQRLGANERGRVPKLEAALAGIERAARAALADAGYRRGVRIERSGDFRYVGQSHTLNVRLRGSLRAETIRRALAKAHQQRFSHADPSRDIEVVVARVKAWVRGFRVRDGGYGIDAGSETGVKIAKQRTVIWDRPRRTRVVPRTAVRRSGIQGPAIVTQYDTTILIPPGWRACPDQHGNLILRRRS